MYLLLYTVTYFSGEANESYGAIVYDDYVTVNGLKLPKSMKGFKYEADTLGEMRYERIFDDIKIDVTALDPALFEIPEGGVIDSLSQ